LRAMCGVAARVGALSLAASCSIFLGACAQITVISDNAPPQTEWKFGVLAIDLVGSSKNTIVQTTGVGLVSTPSGATLGYAKSRIVRIGDECRVVITTQDIDATSKDRKLARQLKVTHKACAA
jgi:hypothetical protein